jgi:hypothetical protein
VGAKGSLIADSARELLFRASGGLPREVGKLVRKALRLAHERAVDEKPVVSAAQIASEPLSDNWLIEDLWTAAAVGWVAGQPKSLKSWTALEMAVSVVHKPGVARGASGA